VDSRSEKEFPSPIHGMAVINDNTPKAIRRMDKIIELSESETDSLQVESEDDFQTPRALKRSARNFASDDDSDFMEITASDTGIESNYEDEEGKSDSGNSKKSNSASPSSLAPSHLDNPKGKRRSGGKGKTSKPAPRLKVDLTKVQKEKDKQAFRKEVGVRRAVVANEDGNGHSQGLLTWL